MTNYERHIANKDAEAGQPTILDTVFFTEKKSGNFIEALDENTGTLIIITAEQAEDILIGSAVKVADSLDSEIVAVIPKISDGQTVHIKDITYGIDYRLKTDMLDRLVS